MNPVENASLRRLVVTLLAPLFVFANSKFGINVSPEVQELVVGLFIAYVLGSNAKEAVIAKAQAAGKAAADAVTADNAAAVVRDAAKPEVKP